MDPSQRPTDIARQLIEINVGTLGELFKLTGTGVKQYMELNADYVTSLAKPNGWQHVAALQRDYKEHLLAGIRHDLHERGQLLKEALQQSKSVFETVDQPLSESASAPTFEVTPHPVPPEPAADDLARINGIGATFARRLAAAGYTRFAQIAELDMAEVADPTHPLHRMKGRMEAEQWIQQAQDLLKPLLG